MAEILRMRTICAHCPTYGRPAKVMIDVPEDARGLSHGICDECATLFIEEAQRTAGVKTSAPTHIHGQVTGPDPRD